jgi:hypothetical protein
MHGEWNEWGRHVLAELKRQGNDIGELRVQNTTIIQRLSRLEGKFTMLKMKFTGLGALIGALASHLAKHL